MCQTYTIDGPIYLISDEPIDSAPTRILERGRLQPYNTKVLTYSASDLAHIPDASLELITLFIGLHHSPKDQLGDFLQTLISKLKT